MLSLKGDMAFYMSNRTCMYCLRRAPEQALTCGHSACPSCVSIFGAELQGRHSRMSLRCLYDDGGLLTVDLKPKTAGVRLLGIDGGGSKGVTPLEFMLKLQEALLDCPLHEMIDLACGSSSGENPFSDHRLF